MTDGLVIDELVKKHSGLNKDSLNAWLKHFGLTSRRAAELLGISKRTFEGYRAGRPAPKLLIFGLREAENELK